MSPNPDEEDRKPSSNLMTDIERSFGSFDKFKEAFTQKALSLFGSGISDFFYEIEFYLPFF